MAIHLGTITVKSKSAWDLIVTRWKESKLQKIRLVVALTAMMISIGSMFDYHIGGPFLLLTVLTLQMCAVFWPNIMGSLVRPILLRTTTLVPAEPKSEIVTGYHHDASWFFYEMSPELRDWYKGNCTGWMGVIPEREVVMRQGKRTFWFTNENDAFAFRMRWAGL